MAADGLACLPAPAHVACAAELRAPAAAGGSGRRPCGRAATPAAAAPGCHVCGGELRGRRGGGDAAAPAAAGRRKVSGCGAGMGACICNCAAPRDDLAPASDCLQLVYCNCFPPPTPAAGSAADTGGGRVGTAAAPPRCSAPLLARRVPLPPPRSLARRLRSLRRLLLLHPLHQGLACAAPAHWGRGCAAPAQQCSSRLGSSTRRQRERMERCPATPPSSCCSSRPRRRPQGWACATARALEATWRS